MVSIILLNWNGKRFLADCIQSLCAQTFTDYELIIVDDHSTDGSQELLTQHYAQYALFFNASNRGYCGGANLGIRNSIGEYVLILNPDVILSPDYLIHIVDAFARDPEVGIVTGKLLRFDRTTLDSTGQFLRKNLTPLERGYGVPDQGQYEQPEYVFSSCGAAACYRRAMLEDIRLAGDYFDEAYFAFYEDLDVGWRAQLLGWKAYYTPSAVAYHYRGGGLVALVHKKSWFELLPGVQEASFTKKPAALQRHIIKNRYLTLLKNASWQDLVHGGWDLVRFEVCLWGYMLCVRPSLCVTLVDLWKLWRPTLQKRRTIHTRKSISDVSAWRLSKHQERRFDQKNNPQR